MGTKQFDPKTGSRGIEWCDETRNAIGGCMHDCKWEMPDGQVAICYAKEIAASIASRAYKHGFEHHYWRNKELPKLAVGKEPLLIFIDSMSDLFDANVPNEHTIAVLEALRAGEHHAYQSLTKAPGRLLQFADHFPPNLWVGVSSPPDWFMGNQLNHTQKVKMLRRSLDVLSEVRERTGNLVWMSAEPVSWDLAKEMDGAQLDWIVIGAASHGKRYYQPQSLHIADLLWLMDSSHTPVFFKGNIRATIEGADLREIAGERQLDLTRWREDFQHSYRDGKPIPAVHRRQRLCVQHGWQLSTFGTTKTQQSLLAQEFNR